MCLDYYKKSIIEEIEEKYRILDTYFTCYFENSIKYCEKFTIFNFVDYIKNSNKIHYYQLFPLKYEIESDVSEIPKLSYTNDNYIDDTIIIFMLSNNIDFNICIKHLKIISNHYVNINYHIKFIMLRKKENNFISYHFNKLTKSVIKKIKKEKFEYIIMLINLTFDI